MVEDIEFRDFLVKSCKNNNLTEEQNEMIENASEYAALMMNNSILFLKETHSMSEEIYIANIAALLLATCPNLDSALHCSTMITARLIDVDGKYNKAV